LGEHGKAGSKYPGTLSSTVASFALGDYEWLLALESTPALAESQLGPWPDFCATSCCPNLRRELPTVAEAPPKA